MQLKLFTKGYFDISRFQLDINAPLPKIAKTEFVKICTVLNDAEINYFVADGTLLGIIREGELIPHDTDLDFYIFGNKKNVKFVKKIMKQNKYKVGRKLRYLLNIQQLSFYNKEKVIVDFCFWYKKGDYLFFRAPEIPRPRAQDYFYFTGETYIKFNGIEFKTFHNPEQWLAMMYGETWRIPETHKTPWIDSIRDLKKNIQY